MDSLLVAKEQELEKKYRDLFERKLEESNAHIESALEKQCKSLVELQESIAQNERREVQALMDQFDNFMGFRGSGTFCFWNSSAS